MSGIAGVIRFGGHVETQELDAMLATMARRGPDRRTSRSQGEAGFGRALLATTREACNEVQPWVHPDSGCMVVSDNKLASRLDNRPLLLRQLCNVARKFWLSYIPEGSYNFVPDILLALQSHRLFGSQPTLLAKENSRCPRLSPTVVRSDVMVVQLRRR